MRWLACHVVWFAQFSGRFALRFADPVTFVSVAVRRAQTGLRMTIPMRYPPFAPRPERYVHRPTEDCVVRDLCVTVRAPRVRAPGGGVARRAWRSVQPARTRPSVPGASATVDYPISHARTECFATETRKATHPMTHPPDPAPSPRMLSNPTLRRAPCSMGGGPMIGSQPLHLSCHGHASNSHARMTQDPGRG